MKNQTQPTHTQGEWIQNGENGIHTKQGYCIALTYGENGLNKKANAQRIVKAVNMHDELIKALETWERWASRYSGITDENLPRVHDTTIRLFKQVEQK